MKKRPILITIMCVIAFIAVIISFVWVFSPFIKRMGEFYPSIYGIIVAFYFMALIGVWNMKQWGVNVYIITFFLKLIVDILVEDVNIFSTVLSVLFIISFLVYYRKMNVNL